MTGDPVPDSKGTYDARGWHEGKRWYARTDDAYFLYWHEVSTQWYISTLLGKTAGDTWYKAGSVQGSYIPAGTYTGTPVATEV